MHWEFLWGWGQTSMDDSPYAFVPYSILPPHHRSSKPCRSTSHPPKLLVETWQLPPSLHLEADSWHRIEQPEQFSHLPQRHFASLPLSDAHHDNSHFVHDVMDGLHGTLTANFSILPHLQPIPLLYLLEKRTRHQPRLCPSSLLQFLWDLGNNPWYPADIQCRRLIVQGMEYVDKRLYGQWFSISILAFAQQLILCQRWH